ncbi:microsomal epoxide hydrolase [Sphaerisporangium melleum]|uniref:Microsomal epoxide hydrolase n=1 Tax=Sphaerisporangium melleum TaxID=321316 RepID=A0A917RPG9_9ACTN|nr:epoxide hydrolase family protein [Sphaerisporangium melleum]GGL18231.1 microsomal epoxide hydrolase [Sphaerisporangium melleum]GII74770.1 microsomal epoxide hydrolase [Sphaerisporangium melleum]
MTTEIKPFRVDVPQAELDDLWRRLAAVRWPGQVTGAGWSRGVPLAYLKDLTEYWTTSYDWRATEKRINQHPQFTAAIDGLDIHFLHIRSRHEQAFPLLLAHGWPGSIAEFLEVIEPLTDPADPADAFHLVIPSHPNFGFTGPAGAGWDAHRIATAYAELMAALGYDRYGAQGGDFGAFIAPDLGRVDAEHVAGVHVNAATAGFIPFGGVPEGTVPTDAEQVRLDRMNRFLADGNGYFQMQATRPHTLGFALADSPTGQLAWIGEKFHDWAHPAGSIGAEHVITHAMIYWLTNTGASSAQMYYESVHTTNRPTPSQVPTGVANFAEDIAIRRFAEPLNNITHWSEYDRGGHFAAMEVPDLFVDEVRTFFRTIR